MQQNLSATTSFSRLEENALIKGTKMQRKEILIGALSVEENATCFTQVDGYLTGEVTEIWWKLRNSYHSENRIAGSPVSR